MATYKVPQDVEADDKLIGPFSFRQFIYLIIVALSGALAWGLSNIFIGLAIIPLPVILLFGALALPLKKDQPMEIYLAAIISYYLKPHKRLWDSDGVETLIEITVPKIVEVQRTKGITQADAEQRFGYLASIVDSGGWAIRGAGAQASPSTTLNSDVILEAQGAQDVLDANTSIAQTFNQMMSREADKVRQDAIDRMRQAPMAAPQPQPAATVIQPAYSIPSPTPQPVIPEPTQQTPVFNPYPTNIQQSIIQPVNDPTHMTAQPVVAPTPIPTPETPPTTSDNVVSAGIMNLANNSDVSIETLAHEAHRIKEKENDMSEEVVISLH